MVEGEQASPELNDVDFSRTHHKCSYARGASLLGLIGCRSQKYQFTAFKTIHIRHDDQMRNYDRLFQHPGKGQPNLLRVLDADV
jgi:hypothetical protein